MKTLVLWIGVVTAVGITQPATAQDARLRSVTYDPAAVTTVYAKRGVATHVLLDASERIQLVATGVGSECGRDEDAWCVVAPKNGTQLFVKPKSAAAGSNNIAISTDRRAYSLRFVLVPDNDRRDPVFRLTFLYPPPLAKLAAVAPDPFAAIQLEQPSEAEILQLRLKQSAPLVNGDYTISTGKRSSDIAPTMVWDDGRFTYFKFPANREIPAVFQVNADGGETVVNARIETEFLVADRVARRFYLRLGKAVVGVYNEAYDLDGVPPANGTTVPGVERVFRAGVKP